MKKHQLASFSWLELKELEKVDKTIIIPLGSTEQQGPHNPIGVDFYVADHIADIVAEASGAFVGPSLPLGYSEWFLDYPGTVSLKMDTYTQVLREYCSCLVRHGFRKIIFFNAHGGNTPAVDVVARELCFEHQAQVAMVEIWKVANSLAKDMDGLKENTVKHAGEIMTSIMLYLDHQMVDMQRAQAEYLKSVKPAFTAKSTLGPSEFKGIEISIYEEAQKLTASGAMGDPMAAASEKGKVIIEHLKSYLVDMVKNF
jgi:creatinine amidohydrolase